MVWNNWWFVNQVLCKLEKFNGSYVLFRKSYPFACPAVICLVKVERLHVDPTRMLNFFLEHI